MINGSVEYVERGVESVENVECGENEECGKCGVW